MKYHTIFFQKIRQKMLQNLSSAAGVIGALRVKVLIALVNLTLSGDF